MKKTVPTTLSILFSTFLFSQSYNNTFSVTGGIFGDGFGGEATFNNNLDEVSFTQIALDVSMDSFLVGDVSIPYSSYALSYSYFTTLYSTARRMKVLSVGAGGVVGYELVNNGNNDLSNIVFVDGESKFIYGLQGTLEIDIIISEHYSLLVKTTQFYHVNSDFGKLTNYSGVGLRYYFNM